MPKSRDLQTSEAPEDWARLRTIADVPEEQQPGHHPEREQDKPDLDDFAARLGIVPEGEEPDDAPRVEDPDYVPSTADGDHSESDDGGSVTSLEDAPSKVQARAAATSATSPATAPAPEARRQFSPIGLALVGPLTGVKLAQRILRAIIRRRG
jgi:hypothetical protein